MMQVRLDASSYLSTLPNELWTELLWFMLMTDDIRVNSAPRPPPALERINQTAVYYNASHLRVPDVLLPGNKRRTVDTFIDRSAGLRSKFNVRRYDDGVLLLEWGCSICALCLSRCNYLSSSCPFGAVTERERHCSDCCLKRCALPRRFEVMCREMTAMGVSGRCLTLAKQLFKAGVLTLTAEYTPRLYPAEPFDANVILIRWHQEQHGDQWKLYPTADVVGTLRGDARLTLSCRINRTATAEFDIPSSDGDIDNIMAITGFIMTAMSPL